MIVLPSNIQRRDETSSTSQSSRPPGLSDLAVAMLIIIPQALHFVLTSTNTIGNITDASQTHFSLEQPPRQLCFWGKFDVAVLPL